MGWLARRFGRGPRDGQRSPGEGARGEASDPGIPDSDDALRAVAAYHRATRHHVHRFAFGPADLDWASQPDPFRRFAGAPLVRLDQVPPTDEPRYEPAFHAGQVAPVPLSARSLAQLLYDALALSAWKQLGDVRWALRVNPSSGNLHPTEGYVVAGALEGVSDTPFVAHYAPREHALELRAELPHALWERLAARLPPGALLVGLTSIHWREAWKYGERAFRYCQHDVGHALGALTVAAAALGWRARLLEGPSSAALARLLGVHTQRGEEAEEPDALVALFPQDAPDPDPQLDEADLAGLEGLAWRGEPNVLSPSHLEWSAVEAAAVATRKPATPAAFTDERDGPWLRPAPAAGAIGREPIALRAVVRQRRSAVALDARSALARDGLLQALDRTLPGPGRLALEVLPWRPRVDLLVFAHRVVDVDPGLYLLARDPGRVEALRAAWREDLEWAPVEGLPAFFRLRRGDARATARAASCHQAIASDGCFAVAMLAELEASLARHGPWMYRRLHWECGLLGQLLYLEAEALGLRGTGIGCFFDDAFGGLVGQRGAAWADLYHFTVGGPLEDDRLTSLPAYPPPGTGG